MKTITFIDLFAGIGGFRIGFEKACKELGLEARCLFTSEIKPHAIEIYKKNFSDDVIYGDITNLSVKQKIPKKFDVLLAGFPCQAFSSAGKRQGFLDTRGTLFFEIEKILEIHNPPGFILENVEGLVNHDKLNPGDKIGQTLSTILDKLETLGYRVTWKVLNASNFGLAQARKRIFIIGTKKHYIHLDNFPLVQQPLKYFLEKGVSVDRLQYIGYGSTKPKYKITERNGYEALKNRRVEILIIDK